MRASRAPGMCRATSRAARGGTSKVPAALDDERGHLEFMEPGHQVRGQDVPQPAQQLHRGQAPGLALEGLPRAPRMADNP